MGTIGFASSWGGCAYYRAELPARALGARGWNTWVTEPFDVDPTTGRIGFPMGENTGFEPDVVILAGGHPQTVGAEVISAARHHGQRIVVDCDDHPELPTDNPDYRIGTAAAKRAALRAADAVIFSTHALLADYRVKVGAEDQPAFVARNMIDPADFAYARAVNLDRQRGAGFGPLRVAYRGLLAGFHDADAGELVGRLPDDVALMHIGAHEDAPRTFAEIVRVPAERVTNVPAVPFAEGYPDRLAGVDFAVIPYAERDFSQAKSNIAGLEWAMAGVPFAVSPHPEYALADWCTDWRATIVAGITDRAHRERIAERQLQWAMDHSIYAAGAGNQWEHALRTLNQAPATERA